MRATSTSRPADLAREAPSIGSCWQSCVHIIANMPVSCSLLGRHEVCLERWPHHWSVCDVCRSARRLLRGPIYQTGLSDNSAQTVEEPKRAFWFPFLRLHQLGHDCPTVLHADLFPRSQGRLSRRIGGPDAANRHRLPGRHADPWKRDQHYRTLCSIYALRIDNDAGRHRLDDSSESRHQDRTSDRIYWLCRIRRWHRVPGPADSCTKHSSNFRRNYGSCNHPFRTKLRPCGLHNRGPDDFHKPSEH